MSALGGIFLTNDAIRAASRLTGISERKIKSRCRTPEVCAVRFAIWLRLRERGMSYEQIGRRFNRDHSTIIAGVKRGESLGSDPEFSQLLGSLNG